jgi:hypothetical protein
MPLKGTIEREETIGVVRVSVMILTSITAMVYFIKSFIANRKARK